MTQRMVQEGNCIIITSNWLAWWSLNDLLLCLVSALGLKEYIGRIDFYPTTHDFSRRFNCVVSGPLIISARPKIDTELYKFIINISKRALF